MMALKFIRHEDSSQVETVIRCGHYDVHRRDDGPSTVTVYPGFTLDGGVEYHIGSGQPGAYDVCYVTNDQGDTTDRIGPRPRGDVLEVDGIRDRRHHRKGL